MEYGICEAQHLKVGTHLAMNHTMYEILEVKSEGLYTKIICDDITQTFPNTQKQGFYFIPKQDTVK